MPVSVVDVIINFETEIMGLKKIGSMVVVLVLIGFLVWGLGSFHASRRARGQDLVRTSQIALTNRKYTRAENKLQRDANVNPEHWRAKQLLSQVQDYLNGKRYLKNNRLDLAVVNYRKASRSNSVTLKKRSLRQIHLINEIENRAVHYNLDYNRAIDNNHSGRFRKSNQELNSFMVSPSLRLSYFKTLRSSANKLKRANNDSTVSNQVKQSCFPELSLSMNKRTICLSGYRWSAVKKEIKAAGINVDKMSRRMVLNIVRQANYHHTSIYEYAKKNY